jgi:hypothetical protein
VKFATTITGSAADVVKRIADRRAAAMKAGAASLYQGANGIIAKAKERTPVLTGLLRSSGFVESPVITPSEVSITIGFGGAAKSYALFVHESLTARHNAPGQAKFLESAVDEDRADVIAAARAAVLAELSK